MYLTWKNPDQSMHFVLLHCGRTAVKLERAVKKEFDAALIQTSIFGSLPGGQVLQREIFLLR